MSAEPQVVDSRIGRLLGVVLLVPVGFGLVIGVALLWAHLLGSTWAVSYPFTGIAVLGIVTSRWRRPRRIRTGWSGG